MHVHQTPNVPEMHPTAPNLATAELKLAMQMEGMGLQQILMLASVVIIPIVLNGLHTAPSLVTVRRLLSMVLMEVLVGDNK